MVCNYGMGKGWGDRYDWKERLRVSDYNIKGVDKKRLNERFEYHYLEPKSQRSMFLEDSASL